MPKYPPFRHFEQIKRVHSRSLLVYKYNISKIIKSRPIIYRALAIAYILPGYSRIVGGVYDVINFSFDNELCCNCCSHSTVS